MNKAYSRITWENKPSKATPLNERNLNKEAAALDVIDDRVVELYNRVDNLEGFQDEAAQAVADMQEIASQIGTDAQSYVNQSKSWAIGEGYPQRTNQATDNSKYYAELAEMAAAEGGYVHFLIDDRGHLLYIKTSNVDDLDFEIRDNTNLWVVIDDGI